MTLKQLLKYLGECAQHAEHELQQDQLALLAAHYDSEGKLRGHVSGEDDLILRDHLPLHTRRITYRTRVPIVGHSHDPHNIEVDLCAGRSKNAIELEIEYAQADHQPEGISLLKEAHINTTRIKP